MMGGIITYQRHLHLILWDLELLHSVDQGTIVAGEMKLSIT